ncbi:MAG TPA: hypothetical protein PKA63_08290 [Oligoflexia bacterium]|nr:hypothetical protein [Oligoflexia bacterium]HMP48650.1 hypothetical protein [Oligoflexia bacterium]
MLNHYHKITQLFNKEKVRVIIASGQAVVLHNLAIMSKDCDWIIREDNESFEYVLHALSTLNAKYRFGAPLSLDWHKEGWSSHFEIYEGEFRLRLDFFSRPPRISHQELLLLWDNYLLKNNLPYIDKKLLIKQKLTDRLKDYAVIGEIVRTINDEMLILQFSQSASDILKTINNNEELIKKLIAIRPVMSSVNFNSQEIELEIRLAIEKERYELMKENLRRIESYRKAAKNWSLMWPTICNTINTLNLLEAHKLIVSKANDILPKKIA